MGPAAATGRCVDTAISGAAGFGGWEVPASERGGSAGFGAAAAFGNTATAAVGGGVTAAFGAWVTAAFGGGAPAALRATGADDLAGGAAATTTAAAFAAGTFGALEAAMALLITGAFTGGAFAAAGFSTATFAAAALSAGFAAALATGAFAATAFTAKDFADLAGFALGFAATDRATGLAGGFGALFAVPPPFDCAVAFITPPARSPSRASATPVLRRTDPPWHGTTGPAFARRRIPCRRGQSQAAPETAARFPIP